MAAGEYESVSSQRDTEEADLAREREELATTPDLEREELFGIYEARGLSRGLAEQVADELATGDLLAGLGSLVALGARMGGAPVLRAAVRVLIGGTLALGISLGIGELTGAVV